MLYLGGDTDTNAAIVGGMLGAAWGLESIIDEKPYWVQRVTSAFYIRPDFLRPAFSLQQLIDLALLRADEKLFEAKMQTYLEMHKETEKSSWVDLAEIKEEESKKNLEVVEKIRSGGLNEMEG